VGGVLMNMPLHSRFEDEVVALKPARVPLTGGLFSRSLRTQGILFNALLVAYIVFIVLYALGQRNEPLQQLEQYQKIQRAQEALIQADLAAFHIVTVLFSGVNQDELTRVMGYFGSLREKYINLQRLFPEQAATFRELVDSIPASVERPSEENLAKIQFHLARSKSKLDQLMTINQERLTTLIEDYRAHNEAVVATILSLGILGLIVFGGLVSLFVHELKRDVRFLQARTAEIIDGYRGKPLPVRRNDEVGQLAQDINHMAEALAEREKALEIQRNKASFVEKMVAIDSLAGGIAHEIGNPVASIVGLAEVIRSDDQSQLSDDSRNNLQSIGEYCDVLVRLTHELSVFDANKQSDEFEWLDINQLLTNTCAIFHYDQRWAGIEVDFQPDATLPAIYSSLNQLTQVVNNILDNARDALAGCEQPRVVIRTRQQGPENLVVEFEDNGAGMENTVVEHIFDPFFSTKPVGQGTGLGLSICWTIVRNLQGIIHAESSAGNGSVISVVLPFAPFRAND
jgi:two-component system NtrC family sensor kinase